jgi:hypothetical protein
VGKAQSLFGLRIQRRNALFLFESKHRHSLEKAEDQIQGLASTVEMPLSFLKDKTISH